MVNRAHSKFDEANIPDRESDLNSAVLNSMASLLIVLDHEGRVVSFNRACESLTGYTAGEVQGKRFWEFLLLPEDVKPVIEVFKDLCAGNFPNAHENYWVTKGGERRLIAWSNTAVVNGENTVGYVVGTGVDVTDLRRFDEKLRLLESAIEQTNDAILITTAELEAPGPQIIFANPAFLRMTGYASEEIIGRTPRFLQGAKTDRAVMVRLRESLKKGEHFRGSTINYRKNGESYDVEWSIAPISDARGKTAYYIAIQQDVTERNRIQQTVRSTRDYLDQIINAVADPIFVKNRRHEWTLVNDAMCEFMGHRREDLIGKSDYDFVPAAEADVFWRKDEEVFDSKEENLNEERLTDTAGVARVVQTRKRFYVNDAGEELIVAVLRDITTHKRLEEQLLHDAFHDNLTGLANRTLFIDHLGKAIERVKRDSRGMLAVLFLDFDRFKMVNDSLGHREGDYLLAQIARRLAASLRSGDLVARLGGDEFAVLVNNIDDSSLAVRVAERLQKNLETPFEVGGGKFSISASIGIALGTTGHEKAEDLLRDADLAMYRAKAEGKARYQVFDRVMNEQASKRLRLEIEMRQALEREEFLLHYQPIIELKTRRLVGFEALVRWRHPERGMIPPLEFIAAAEENRLILPLGKWILHESCRQLRAWQITIGPVAAALTISVNLSSKQFSQPNLPEQIKAALEETRLDAANLKLEITESHVMENSETAIKTISGLRDLGVALSLDDFGTGYSSLSYLHRLPLSYLKIDRSFVSRMSESEEKAQIVRTIVELAHNLKMRVVAEGIETAEQMRRLKKLNCEYGQGFLFSKPLAVEDAEAFIRTGPVANPH